MSLTRALRALLAAIATMLLATMLSACESVADGLGFGSTTKAVMENGGKALVDMANDAGYRSPKVVSTTDKLNGAYLVTATARVGGCTVEVLMGHSSDGKRGFLVSLVNGTPSSDRVTPKALTKVVGSLPPAEAISAILQQGHVAQARKAGQPGACDATMPKASPAPAAS